MAAPSGHPGHHITARLQILLGTMIERSRTRWPVGSGRYHAHTSMIFSLSKVWNTRVIGFVVRYHLGIITFNFEPVLCTDLSGCERVNFLVRIGLKRVKVGCSKNRFSRRSRFDVERGGKAPAAM